MDILQITKTAISILFRIKLIKLQQGAVTLPHNTQRYESNKPFSKYDKGIFRQACRDRFTFFISLLPARKEVRGLLFMDSYP